MAETSQTRAAKFKDEGNALFVKKEFGNASKKFTSAIELDPTNAVYYCNRAACFLCSRKYRDAASDAKKATELDPLYPKAWARRAAAHAGLGENTVSAEFWEKAIQTMPPDNMTDEERKQKRLYGRELETLKAKITAQQRREAQERADQERVEQERVERERAEPRRMQSSSSSSIVRREDLPFNRAIAMEDELFARGEEGVRSSAWVILGAYREFQRSLEYMMDLGQMPLPSGEYAMIGHSDGIPALAEAIMRDPRAIDIGPNFIALYNKQAIFEAQRTDAWVEGGSAVIIEKAKERLREKGWGGLRPALGATVRAYIIRGFLETWFRQDFVAGVDFLSRVSEILEWGSNEWKDIPIEDKGTIFRGSFIRGVGALYMEAYMEASLAPGGERRFPLLKLYAAAQKATLQPIVDIPSISQDVDPGFVSSFYIYPRGHAFAMIGLYHSKMAERVPSEEKSEHYLLAMEGYIDAARHFPEDDEHHAWYLKSALGNLCRMDAPVRAVLTLMERIRLAVPEFKKIWEFSSMGRQGRDNTFESIARYEQEIRAGLLTGKFTMDGHVRIEK